MDDKFEMLTHTISDHRVMKHPFFTHWEQHAPRGEVFGAIFDQVQHFCSATRPGHNLSKSLRELNLNDAAHHIDEIVASESGHGTDLATMIAYLMNRDGEWHTDLTDREAIEYTLRQCSDNVFADSSAEYDRETGLLKETHDAMAVFDARKESDTSSIAYALGTTIALETVSDDHLIPGEIAMVRAYEASLDTPEMHYLKEHGGEDGAEHAHEEYAIGAVKQFIESPHMNDETWNAMQRGAQEFCDRLADLWDVLDAKILDVKTT